MAYIGMRYPVAAAISAETAGSEPTYSTGFVVGKAISANLTITRNDNPLYADDAIAEEDNGITAMSIEVGTDDLIESVQENLLGVKKAGTTPTVYYDTDEAAPYVGFGYMRVRRLNGSTKYQAIWMHKVQFGQTSEAAQTKGESIEWQTPTITGRVMGVSLNSPAAISFRKRAEFDTEAAAKSWLNTQANISSGSST